ncbi:MAG: S9 family peptidase [Actinomycetota bacterium]|nr:S9 family peptidase [Actinomycetota bacterium]
MEYWVAGRGGRYRWLAAAAWLWLASTLAFSMVAGPSLARAKPAVPGLPSDVPAAASQPSPALPAPSSGAWPFPSRFPQTSGTGRLAAGASLWSDFVYDDYGASGVGGLGTSSYDSSSGLAARQGGYVFGAGAAHNNGADIFRAGVGLHGGYSYWRVDWVTLADPRVPLAEWTFDTDNNAATGAVQWPAQAGVRSAGIDQAMVVSSRGAWLVNPVTGIRTNVLAHGGALTVDRTSKSFIVAVPRALLPVSGTWRVRLGAGLADAAGQNFAVPDVGQPGSHGSSTAERLYNVTFRTVGQEPPVYTDGMSDALIAQAQARLAGNPIGATLGADGTARSVTGNFWMEDDQADTLASGDVSKFSLVVDWPALGARQSTGEPQPTGYSTRWYVSRLADGAGQVVNDGSEGNFKPTLLERVQPYSVYVPTTYRRGRAMPLTWILHSLEVNYNQYGALDPQLIQQLCQDRGSICATTEGLGPAGWYFHGAETDFWQVWRALASAFSLNPARTVISGYSMGGWASYKLAFEHPDDFAGALSIDGPVICGVQAYPGLNAPAYSDPACSQDGRSAPLVANARWVPYVIDQTYADELVPTTGVIAQAQTFDSLGQRYNLFIHTGADHLVFATEDQFGDVVSALGRPVRTVNPGLFTYHWYPSLDSSQFGIGATGDYWIHALRARGRAYGQLATVRAQDSALPDRAITDQRFGPRLVTQPLPGTNTGLGWRLGPRPAPRRHMNLDLTDVSGMAIDSRAARLRIGTIVLSTDGRTRLVIVHLRPGTGVYERGRRLTRANRHGTAVVTRAAGRHVLVLRAPVRLFSCVRPSGRVTGRSLGPVRLGMTRRQARARFARRSLRGRRYMDFFCPSRMGIRVGYATPVLLASLPPRARAGYRHRAVLVLTAARHFGLRGVHPRAALTTVARRLHVGRGFQVGRNRWYLFADGASRGVFKVRHGMIQEIGIANARLTRDRRAAYVFLRSFF